MQSASNRDDYVTIIWENIKPGAEHNFISYDEKIVNDFGVEYEYNSVMHYPSTAFSVNGNKTIIPRDPEAHIGQRENVTDSDYERINKMYNCGTV